MGFLSFWNWTLLTPTSPPGQLFILPLHCISLPQALGWKPGLGAGSGAPGQANVALWTILQLPWCPRTVRECFPNLFVHLLFQMFFNTVHRLEEDDTFWRECQDQHSLPTNPNRFAVLTIKALLCHLQCEGVVMALECKCGWDTLLNADTQHYAVGLLAREMGSACTVWCCSIVCCLLELLSEEMCPWELPAMVFLVEAKRMCSLTESLVQLLWDADGELVRMTATVLEFLSLEKDI
ncbi:PREDICTED: uncharacterized protein LOC108503999 isoform X2 [Lepidothrix coronata]|uniref:Uncharacterized protein LOC108503999 isoform X2 n=1 Tax=Lepidothrix coronata TaxID=321398 RepID=A0A6J0IDA7_9PASS|nr:PREDICTED: uncharacterized protein LOC108503999 isoform X2 [Lepidothrix coronata]